jgi:hypothetical protein
MSALQGLYLGEVLAGSMAQNQANARMRQANQNLATAERYHRGSISVLGAALAALDADHPLQSAGVRAKIKAQGEATTTYEQAWVVDCDPAAIKAQLMVEHEQQRAKTQAKISATPIKSKRVGWFWNRRKAFFWGNNTEHASASAALTVQQAARQLAGSAQLDEVIEFDALILATVPAMEATPKQET